MIKGAFIFAGGLFVGTCYGAALAMRYNKTLDATIKTNWPTDQLPTTEPVTVDEDQSA